MTNRKKNVDGWSKCSSCYQLKPFSDFGKDTRAWSGIRGTCKMCRRQEHTDYLMLLKYEVMSHYAMSSPSCVRCGITDIDVLNIDHINGQDNMKRTGGHLYRWLRTNNYPNGYQVLCFNCNFKKSLRG